MARTALLVQQQSALLDKHEVLSSYSDPWQWWTPKEMANIAQCPLSAVSSDWPIVHASLETRSLADYDTCRVVISTIAIETAHTFKPVPEAFWMPGGDVWRMNNLTRYAPYWGRGYIQLTWKENYEYYGWKIGHPELVDFPDKALLPEIAADVLAAYVQERGIHIDAQRHNWEATRKSVQGGLAGFVEYVSVIEQLDEAKIVTPLNLSAVLARGYTRLGDPYVVDGEQPGGFDCSGFIKWVYKGAVDSYTDTIFLQTQENLHPAPGDVVLYEYPDPNQPDTRFPHVGLWLNANETLDARWGAGVGVGVHPHIEGATQYIRRVPGVRVDTSK